MGGGWGWVGGGGGGIYIIEFNKNHFLPNNGTCTSKLVKGFSCQCTSDVSSTICQQEQQRVLICVHAFVYLYACMCAGMLLSLIHI